MLAFFNSWALFTLVLFYWGPIPWENRDSYAVAAIVISSMVGFNLGNRLGKIAPALRAHEFSVLDNKGTKWLIILLFLALSQLHIKSLTGQSIFNPLQYSLEFNAVYANFQNTVKDRSFSAGNLESILFLLKAFLMPTIIILIVLNYRSNVAALLLLLFPFIASSMMRGTDKETVDVVLYLLVLAFYHKLLGRRAVLALAMIGVVVALFVVRKMARFDGVTLNCLPGSPEACFDFGNALSLYVSPSLEFLRIMLANYVTQGYEGLARAVEIPFEFNYFLGHMAPVKLKICQVFGALCDIQSYNDKLPDYGWDTRYKWSSAYTAIANDFTWFFIPVYTFCLGVIFGASEKAWYENGDKLSLACLLLVSVFMVYSSANMQISTSLEWSAVYLVLFLWQGSRIVGRRRRSPVRSVDVMGQNPQASGTRIGHLS